MPNKTSLCSIRARSARQSGQSSASQPLFVYHPGELTLSGEMQVDRSSRPHVDARSCPGPIDPERSRQGSASLYRPACVCFPRVPSDVCSPISRELSMPPLQCARSTITNSCPASRRARLARKCTVRWPVLTTAGLASTAYASRARTCSRALRGLSRARTGEAPSTFSRRTASCRSEGWSTSERR